MRPVVFTLSLLVTAMSVLALLSVVEHRTLRGGPGLTCIGCHE